MKPVTRWIDRAEHYMGRPWGLPAAASLGLMDVFVGFIPTDAILIGVALLHPRRWVAIVIWFTIAAIIGAALLGFLVQSFGADVVSALIPGALESQSWAKMEDAVAHYGAPALVIVALSPIPQQIAIGVAVLAGLPVSLVTAMIALGKVIKYIFFGWAASHAPRLLTRLPGLAPEVKQLSEREKP